LRAADDKAMISALWVGAPARMRTALLVVWLGLVPSTGCTLASRAVYNMHYDKTLRADLEQRHASHRKLGQEAWLETWAAGMDAAPDAAFGEGFVDGFADFLDRGGSGDPPSAPPNAYRFGEALSPAGHMAAARYFDGFAEGARAARASGFRADVLVPLPWPSTTQNYLPIGSDCPGTRPETLPAPRQLGPMPREIRASAARPTPRQSAVGSYLPESVKSVSPSGP
jgi:hypothetical protein